MTALSRFAGLPRHLNPRLMPIAGKLPPLAVIHHQGRRSGTRYASPVQAYRTTTGYIVGLAYSKDANWALNLLSSGHGTLDRGRHTYNISNPRRQGLEARQELPAPVALLTRALGIDHFIAFDTTPSDQTPSVNKPN